MAAEPGTTLALMDAVERLMKNSNTNRIAITAVAVGLLCSSVAPASKASMRGEEIEPGFIKRVVAQTTRSGLAVRATRDLRAGTVSGKHQGWMRVETVLTPAGKFSWTVLEEGGSNRTRDKVFRAVLETEAESCREGERDAAAVTPANYSFVPMGQEASGLVKIRLQPRREDPRLIDGILTVSADGYPLRLEGRLAKSPSFWVKSVHVVKQYGRFAGVALPTVVESTADLKLVGKSTFRMRYDYREVNGRTFAGSAAIADSNP